MPLHKLAWLGHSHLCNHGSLSSQAGSHYTLIGTFAAKSLDELRPMNSLTWLWKAWHVAIKQGT